MGVGEERKGEGKKRAKGFSGLQGETENSLVAMEEKIFAGRTKTSYKEHRFYVDLM